MIWTEALFSLLPIDRKKIAQQMLARLLFLFLIWLTGLAASALDGLSSEYASNTGIYMTIFGSGFIILFGVYMVQESLPKVVESMRPLLRLDDSKFKDLFEKIESYSYSFVPNFLIALLLVVFLSGIGPRLGTLLETLHGIWELFFLFFLNLLSATGIWMGVSIWLTIFLISRQPLQIELSRKTIDKFKGLTNLALWFALFYFLSISIGIIIPLSSAAITSIIGIIASPLVIYLAVGVVGVLFPFYNIHRTLVTLKRQELLRIEEELELLEEQLNEALAAPALRSKDSPELTHRLFSLQIKERRVKAAQEWPFDIGFMSKLFGLVLTPVAARIIAEISNILNL